MGLDGRITNPANLLAGNKNHPLQPFQVPTHNTASPMQSTIESTQKTADQSSSSSLPQKSSSVQAASPPLHPNPQIFLDGLKYTLKSLQANIPAPCGSRRPDAGGRMCDEAGWGPEIYRLRTFQTQAAGPRGRGGPARPSQPHLQPLSTIVSAPGLLATPTIPRPIALSGHPLLLPLAQFH